MAESGRSPAKRKRPASLRSPARAADAERLMRAAERLAVQTQLGKSFTTNALAKAGIMSVGSIHTHHGTRDAIVAELLRRQASRLTVVGPDLSGFDKMQVLSAHAEAAISLVAASPELYSVLPAEERRQRKRGMAGVHATFRLSLRQALERPDAPLWRPLDVIVEHLSAVMLAMAEASVHSAMERRLAVRNMQMVAITMLDSCGWVAPR